MEIFKGLCQTPGFDLASSELRKYQLQLRGIGILFSESFHKDFCGIYLSLAKDCERHPFLQLRSVSLELCPLIQEWESCRCVDMNQNVSEEFAPDGKRNVEFLHSHG